MSLDTHLDSLESKHKNLERAILEETHRPSPDTIRLRKLKREKLRIKEEISRYS